MEAIAYYRKYLMQWQDTHLAQTNQAVTLLAYPPEKAFGPYKVRLCVPLDYRTTHSRLATVRPSTMGDLDPILSTCDL